MARDTRFAQARHAKRQMRMAQRAAGSVSGGRAPTISRTGGGFSGNMGNWSPRRIGYSEEGNQRERLADRANDLVANDPHACSLINSINVNAVGPGLWPH